MRISREHLKVVHYHSFKSRLPGKYIIPLEITYLILLLDNY